MIGLKKKEHVDFDMMRDSFVDKSYRYPIDALLRKHGFEIVSRPEKGPVLWKRKGVIYEENRAVAYASTHEPVLTQEGTGVA